MRVPSPLTKRGAFLVCVPLPHTKPNTFYVIISFNLHYYHLKLLVCDYLSWIHYLQGTLGRCPPPILFVRTYVVVLEKLSDTYFFLRAQNGL